MRVGDIEINWLGHSGIKIKNSKVIYIDPYNLQEGKEYEKADFILITHSHYDHCSFADMECLVKEGTKVVVPADCQSKITRFKLPVNIEIVEPNTEKDFQSLKIFVLPAYNTDKPFHRKDENWVGYLIKMDSVLIYHSGDTDKIPEMQKLTGHKQPGRKFIAFLPVGGRFTMSAEEAAEAADLIKPDLAIPIHYASIVGSEEDAQEFKLLCEEKGIHVEILEKD